MNTLALLAFLAPTARAQTCGEPVPKEAFVYESFTWDEPSAVTATPDWVAVGMPTIGEVKAYRPQDGSWVSTTAISVNGALAGASLDADSANNRLVIGGPDDKGAAWVREYDPVNHTWSGTAELHPFPAPLDDAGNLCGTSVAISGNWAAVGCPGGDATGASDAGEVHLYKYSGGSWTFEQQLMSPDTVAGGAFGTSVALDGVQLAVGQPAATSGGGSVHVFDRVSGTWTHAWTDDRTGLGPSVGLDDGTLVAGAPDVSQAYVYDDFPVWGLEATPSGSGDFGVAVDVEGSDIAIGADTAFLAHGESAGNVFLYQKSLGIVSAVGELGDVFARSRDAYGRDVAVTAGLVAVAAPDALLDGSEGYAVIHNTATSDDLVISEVLPSHGTGWWVEILNRGDQPIDLTGYRVANGLLGVQYEFDALPPAATPMIDPGERLVLASSAASYAGATLPDHEFVDTSSSVPDMVAITGGILDPDPAGAAISLLDACGSVVDAVAFGPAGTSVAGGIFLGRDAGLEVPAPYTVAMANEAFDGHSPLNWIATSCVNPRTPNDVDPNNGGASFVRSNGDGSDVDASDGLCADAWGHCSLRAAIETGGSLATFCLDDTQKLIQPATKLPAISSTSLDASGSPARPQLDGSAVTGHGLNYGNSSSSGVTSFEIFGFSGGGGVRTGTSADGVYFSDVYLHDNRQGAVLGGDSSIDLSFVTDNTFNGIRYVAGTSGSISGTLVADNGLHGLKVEDHDPAVPMLVQGVDFATNDRDGVQVRNGAGVILEGNTFYANGSDGIDLTSGSTKGGATLNDDGDGDTGGNGIFNKPYIESISVSGTTLTVRGMVAAGATVEFYLADPTGQPELPLATFVEGGASDGDSTIDDYNEPGVGAETNISRFEFVVSAASAPSGSNALTATATDAVEGTSEAAIPVAFVVP